VADISSNSGSVSGDQRPPAPRGATYVGTYNLKTNLLTGDETILESGYIKTSGDYDGSITVDQNDANLWFKIWDNYDAPIANAGADKYSYTGDKINFDGSKSIASTGSSIVKFEWDFESDGIVDTEGEKTSFTYGNEGTYTCLLKVTDSIGEWDEDTCLINVLSLPNESPIADFTYFPVNPTIQDTVSFIDQSTDPDGSIMSWSWDFGDGATSTDRNPSHQYSAKGDYTVKLTVTDNNEGQDSFERSLSIHNIAPTASFTYSPSELKVGEDIQFNDKSTDPEGTQLSWFWDFGDEHNSTEKNPAHKYTSKGTYEVTLTVTDDEGFTDATSKTITVLNKPPIASFQYNPFGPTIYDTINFTNTSEDSYGTIVSRFWDFGDGTNSTLQNPSHSFTQKGEYIIALTVTDNDGAQSSTSQSIVVLNLPPNANFDSKPPNPRTNMDVQFTDRSTDPENISIFSWSWDFGDGYTSDIQSPTHKFSLEGNYNVTLTIWDDENATGTFSMTISVTEPPPQETSVSIPLWLLALGIAAAFAISISVAYVWNKHRKSAIT